MTDAEVRMWALERAFIHRSGSNTATIVKTAAEYADWVLAAAQPVEPRSSGGLVSVGRLDGVDTVNGTGHLGNEIEEIGAGDGTVLPFRLPDGLNVFTNESLAVEGACGHGESSVGSDNATVGEREAVSNGRLPDGPCVPGGMNGQVVTKPDPETERLALLLLGLRPGWSP